MVAKYSEPLATEFSAYMRDLGMAACTLPGDWKNLFCRRDVADAFYEAIREMRSFFQQKGAHCQADPSRRGIQVKHPNEWIHLLYIYAFKTCEPIPAGIASPYLIANIFVSSSKAEHARHLHPVNMQIDDGLIVGRVADERASWNKDLVLRHEFITQLNDYLAGSATETREKLRNFGQQVLASVS